MKASEEDRIKKLMQHQMKLQADLKRKESAIKQVQADKEK